MINFIIKQRGPIINYFGFSIVWICCASTPALEMPFLAPIVTIIFLLLHFSIIAYNRDKELKLIIFSVLLGIVVDSGFAIMNIVQYNGVISAIPNFAPIWILCMWAGFASQVNYAMKYLKGKYPLIGFYGLLDPLEYIGGEKINAVTIMPENSSYIIISITWSISFLLLFKVSEYLMNE